MKRRVLASGILLFILLLILDLTAHAEEIRPYPYRQFAEGDAYTKSNVSQESEMLNAVKEDLLLSSVMRFEGYVKGEGKFIEQKAETTLPLPAGFKEAYHFYQDVFYIGSQNEEGHCRIRIRVANDAFSSFESDVEDLKKQMELEQKGESWDLFSWRTSDHNQIEDPYQVTEEPDGSTLLVLHLKDESTNDDGAYGYNEIIWKARVFRIEGLPNLHFIASCKTQFSIGTGRFLGDYDPAKHAELYKAMIERHNKEKEAFLALRIDDYITTAENYRIKWMEPDILQDFDYVDVIQNAEETPGEDGGVSVPAAIVIGVIGGGAAIAGAAAASGGGSDDKKKKQKSYKMYVQKDFGDAIRRGGDKPVKIRARMAEVDLSTGAERDRNDLTGNIGVSADGMTVHGAALVGRYCEATVSVPENNQNDTASITFTFTGEGGSFTNTVVFRIVEGPTLKFVDERDGTLYGSGCGIDAIPGDGFTYTERFAIVDAPTAPKLSDITAVNTGEFDVEFALTDQPAVYRMTVKNNTSPDPDHDIFAKPKDKDFEIHVLVEGEKEPVKGYVTVKLYPEGITVSSTMEGKKKDVKYVRVQAYEKEYVGDLDKKWQVSEMQFTLAVKGEDKAIVDPKEAEYQFEKLKGSGGKGTRADKEESVAEKYEYKESWGDWNGRFTYTFEPNSTLCEPGDGQFFVVCLPVSCIFDGQKYEAEVPLRLVGEPFDPMAGWEEEYKKLQGRIEKYSLPDNKDDLLKRLAKLAEDPRCSVEELRLTSKYVVRQYMTYWTVQSMKHQDEAKVYDVIIDYLEWAKFFGDCAFSFLVNAYAGPVADAILSPTKDFLTEAIGETVARWMRGQKIDFDVYKSSLADNVLGIFDNLVSGNISFSSWKQAAYSLGAYFAYASVKNFYMTLIEEDRFDLYGALVKGFSDMTSAGLKAAASHLFDAALKKCPAFRAKLSAWCGQFVSKNLGASASLFDLRAVDGVTRSQILRKYLDGLFGMAIDKLIEKDGEIHDKFVKSETGFEFDQNGHLIVQFFFEVAGRNYDCKVDVTKALANAAGGFFGYVFDLLYGEIPTASALISAPTDPPLAPEKN